MSGLAYVLGVLGGAGIAYGIASYPTGPSVGVFLGLVMVVAGGLILEDLT